MATSNYAGPVDFLVFTFPRGADLAPGLAALLERVGQGIIDILDLEFVSVAADGSAVRLPTVDALAGSGIDAEVFDGADSGILDAADLAAIATELESDQLALAVFYEDRSLAAAADAWSTVGGRELFAGGIDIDDLDRAINEGITQ